MRDFDFSKEIDELSDNELLCLIPSGSRVESWVFVPDWSESRVLLEALLCRLKATRVSDNPKRAYFLAAGICGLFDYVRLNLFGSPPSLSEVTNELLERLAAVELLMAEAEVPLIPFARCLHRYCRAARQALGSFVSPPFQ